MRFKQPPLQQNEKQEIRTVGFELEFTGIDLAQSSKLIANLFGGWHQEDSKFAHRITGSRYGDFSVEIDTAILKDKSYEDYLAKAGIDAGTLPISDALEEVLEKIASAVVPYEIVTPPLPLTKLSAVDMLRGALQKHKAMGTKASVLYAFGLHINPEIPSCQASTILNYLKAFLLLYHWIYEESHIDWTRRVVPYINEFPDDYVRHTLNPEYHPSLEQLIDDYLKHNTTRNRPLDMLPLFAFLDQERINHCPVERELIKPRPAFHYRLPNCLIDDPDWNVATEWNYWIEVERLANAPGKIKEMSRAYLTFMDSSSSRFKKKWSEKVNEWIN